MPLLSYYVTPAICRNYDSSRDYPTVQAVAYLVGGTQMSGRCVEVDRLSAENNWLTLDYCPLIFATACYLVRFRALIMSAFYYTVVHSSHFIASRCRICVALYAYNTSAVWRRYRSMRHVTQLHTQLIGRQRLTRTHSTGARARSVLLPMAPPVNRYLNSSIKPCRNVRKLLWRLICDSEFSSIVPKTWPHGQQQEIHSL